MFLLFNRIPNSNLQKRFVGTLKLMIAGLRDKLHLVINKNAFSRKWISKVITSDVLYLSPHKFLRQCFKNMKFMKAALWNKLHATISRNTFSSKEKSKVVPSSIFPSMQEVSRGMALEPPTFTFKIEWNYVGWWKG